MRPHALIATVCLAQLLGQLGAFVFPALLPGFIVEWQLTHTEAGWLVSVIFGSYALAVLVLVTATDRFEARRVYLLGVTATTASHLGMAFLAHDFASAMVFRILAGVGWAGTYMVGLKVMSDELEGRTRSRAVSIHAAGIGLSGGLSYLLAGEIGGRLGWEAAFLVCAGASAGACIIAFRLFPRRVPAGSGGNPLADFAAVFRNRSAMAYIAGYGVHTWEMFTLRSWVVTFLTFAMIASGVGPEIWLVPTVVAFVMELCGTAASIVGNELAIRLGRQRWIFLCMGAGIALASVTGFVSAWGYWAAALLCLVYNMVIYADSAALTAGTVGASDPERRGATLALHALSGYGCGFVGPLVMGIIIDAMGGESVLSWGVGFAHIVIVMALGPLVLLLLRPADLAGDRNTGQPR